MGIREFGVMIQMSVRQTDRHEAIIVVQECIERHPTASINE